MFRTYDDWKLATPPEYEWGDPPPSEEDDMYEEEPPMSLVCIQLDDRNDPPML